MKGKKDDIGGSGMGHKWMLGAYWGLEPTNVELGKVTQLYYDKFLEQDRLISTLLQKPFESRSTYAEIGKLDLIL